MRKNNVKGDRKYPLGASGYEEDVMGKRVERHRGSRSLLKTRVLRGRVKNKRKGDVLHKKEELTKFRGC